MKELNKYLVDARKLKLILSNKSDFYVWVKRNIKNNNLIEGKDFLAKKEEINLSKKCKGIKINYFLTNEATKKIILGCSKNKIALEIKEDLEGGMSLDDILRKENQEMQVKVIRFYDDEYPEQLRQIKNAPKQLYVKGNVQNLKEYGIAIVGTRHCSNYGRTICKTFTKNLVGYNLNIISGLAIGIDGCAHRACIEAKGKTIAVLPSGFDKIYPKENEPLLNRILESGGTVITEYPSEFEKNENSCKERNRIVSALSIGTLVVEAEKRSGTSTTVGYANEQGKKTFCIPSSLLNSKGVGTNEMIKVNKAKIVTTVEDIIKEFPELKLERKSDFEFREIRSRKKGKTSEKNIKLKIEEESLDVYNTLITAAKTIDEIAKELNRPISEITYKLTLLELQGVIKELPGKKFQIK